MALYDFLFGREGQFKQAPSDFDPQQQQALQGSLQQGLQGLGTGAIEEQARRGFRQNTVPLLSERFAKAGGIGSSGYQNALQGAGTELETDLAAFRQRNAMNLLGLGLTPYQGQQYFEPGTEGIAGDLTRLAANAGLAYATGGLSEAPLGIMGLFKKLFGGNQAQTPSAYTGIEAEASSPLRQRLAGQSPINLLGQAATGGMNHSLFSSGGSLASQPMARNYPTALNQMRRPGALPGINLLNQAYGAGMPSVARGLGLQAALNKPYPGFEL